jgi:hypothetical protein
MFAWSDAEWSGEERKKNRQRCERASHGNNDSRSKTLNLYSEKFLHECQIFGNFLYKHVRYSVFTNRFCRRYDKDVYLAGSMENSRKELENICL